MLGFRVFKDDTIKFHYEETGIDQHYECNYSIGEGAFGEVYLGTKKNIEDRYYAIKELNKNRLKLTTDQAFKMEELTV